MSASSVSSPDTLSADGVNCPCGNALVRDGATVKSHWPGSICEDCEAAIFARHAAPKCWRCKTRPGVVDDGTSHSCVECAGLTGRQTREMLAKIDEAVRKGLPAWPRIMDRVEFVRECIKLQREAALSSERPTLSQADESLIDEFARAVIRTYKSIQDGTWADENPKQSAARAALEGVIRERDESRLALAGLERLHPNDVEFAIKKARAALLRTTP